MSKTRPDPGSPPSTPRWVKILAIIFIILAVAFIILHLMGFGMGGHGLSSHTLLIEYGLKPL
jgi:hypothetical protein